MSGPSRGLSEPTVVLLLALFASVWTSGHFLYRGTLYWDNLESYSFYYDSFHSLNVFGEPAY